jgi:hypothetical protein
MKVHHMRKRLMLAAGILTGRWKAVAAQRQAELEAAISHSQGTDGRLDVNGVPADLEAVLLHAATMALEIERLSALYASLAARLAALEQAPGRTVDSPAEDEPDPNLL